MGKGRSIVTDLNPKGLVTDLSKSEKIIVTLIAEGFLDKEIATKLGISVETVKSNERRIREKLDLLGIDSHTRVRLARLMWEGRII